MQKLIKQGFLLLFDACLPSVPKWSQLKAFAEVTLVSLTLKVPTPI